MINKEEDKSPFEQCQESLVQGHKLMTKIDKGRISEPSKEEKRSSVPSPFKGSAKASLFETRELYLKDDEITPLQNAEAEWAKVALDIKTNDWEKQFESCNILRRMSKYHIHVIVNPHLILTELLKMVESLRSGLAKNSLLTIGDLFSNIKKGLDVEVDAVLRVLLKKSVDTNEFISKQSEATMIMSVHY